MNIHWALCWLPIARSQTSPNLSGWKRRFMVRFMVRDFAGWRDKLLPCGLGALMGPRSAGGAASLLCWAVGAGGWGISVSLHVASPAESPGLRHMAAVIQEGESGSAKSLLAQTQKSQSIASTIFCWSKEVKAWPDSGARGMGPASLWAKVPKTSTRRSAG